MHDLGSRYSQGSVVVGQQYTVDQNHLKQPGHRHGPGQLFGWILSKDTGQSKT